jgi:signal transduction histidine kinase
LYPVNLEKFGLILTLEALISNVNESLPIQLIINHDYQKRPISFEVQIYRIIQEFLSNVIKHAKASNMLIHIRDTETSLAVILSDNGVGFDNSVLKKGMGLKNIDSRIKSINAFSKWKSEKGNGSRLIIILPIQ